MSGQASRGILLLVDAVLLVHWREVLGKSSKTLGAAEQQEAVRSERVMQSGNHPLLQDRAKINEQITAADQVEIGKGRVLCDVLLGKNAHFADGLNNLVSAVDSQEEPAQTFGRDAGDQGLRVETGAGTVERTFADIGGENLEGGGAEAGLGGPGGLKPQVFEHGHGQRVGFLAGGASGHPNSYRAAAGVVAEQGGQNVFAKGLESFGIAEEAGHMNENVLVEFLDFSGSVAGVAHVVFEFFEFAQDHATLDAALERSLLVVGKVDSDVFAEEGQQNLHRAAAGDRQVRFLG